MRGIPRGLIVLAPLLLPALSLASARGGSAAVLSPQSGYAFAVPESRSSETPGETLSLEQAVTLALEGNRQVRNAALEVSKAEDELVSYRTKGLPSFNLYALEGQGLNDIKVHVPAGAFGTFPATGPIPAAGTEVTTPAGRKILFLGQIAQPLTQLPRVSLGVRLKHANLEIAREELRARRQTIVNDVRRAYYSLLQVQSALAAEEEALRFLSELDRVVEARVAQRVELLAGGMEVKARLAKEEHDALSLRNRLATGRERLNDLLGRAIDVPFSIVSVPEVTPYESDLEAARAVAMTRRADLKKARLQQQQAEFDRRIKKWDFVPDVNLTYSYLGLPDVDLLPRSYATVGLLLSWEPFDWGRRRRALAEARKTVEENDTIVREAESLAAIDVGERFRNLQEARSLMDATRLAQDAAREKLTVTTEKYRQRTALLKDVLEDQDRLAEADRQREDALLSAWTARADLEKAMGED